MRYVFDDYLLDTRRYECWHRGERVKLRPKVFQVLAYLIGHRDRVVSKDELLEHLWPQQFIGDGTLNACLMAVRKAIGDSGQAQRYIHTLHGRGYRFVAAVEEQDDTPLGHATVSLAHPAQGAEALTRGHPAVIATPAPGPADPATSVSPLLPREAQEPPASPTLDHEYKYVTVLCCGLTAAAPLAARLGAEAMHHLMQAFFTSAQTTVERYGGSLLHYGGDGFLALFGAPVAHEDHARQAVLAALELRQRLGTPQALPGHQHSAPLAVSMGVHTGPVVVGGLDINPQRLYTALGTTTALAAHLQHVAPSEGIVLSAATYQLVQEEVQGEKWESSAGSESPLLRPVYTVRGITQRRAGVPRRRSPYYSPFIGRAQELAILHARLAQAERGQGQCIGITGEPGIGKSRLLTEFQRSMRDQQVTARAGQCLPYGRATPYLPLLTLLRQHCRITDTDRTDAIRANVQHAAQEAHLSAEEEAVLLQFLDIPIETTPLALCSPEVRQARIFAVLRQVLVHSRQQPLLLVIEDIHWIDPTSEAWLAAVVAGLADRAVLILVTYRPGYQPPWMGHSCVTQLALSSLSPQESLLVVQAVPQITQGPDHLRQAIVAQAAGNPFFLEELAWTVVEHGDVAAPLRIPETIQAVLAARIDRLPQDTKRLLQLAAVIGPEVTSPLLGAVADLPEEALLPHLQHLQRTEFLYEARLIPAAVYTFKHALTREVAYQSLLTNTRQAYHQRIAQIFESHFPDQAITQPALVAYHYTEAGSYQPAINAWHRAGEHALQRGAYHEAREHLRQGLALLQTLPESCERTQGELNLCLVLGPILMLTQGASAPEVEHVYTRAYALCQEVEETPQLVAALRGLQHFYRTHGQLHPARALAERLLALAQSRQDAVLLIEAYMSLGATLLPLGAFGPALTHLEHGLACRGPALSLPLPDIPHPVVGCLLYSGLALWYLGYPEQARTRIHEGLAVAQQLVYPHHLGWSQHLSATFSQLCRDVGAVQALADTVVTSATEQGWQLGLIEGQCLQGWVLAQHGRGRAGIDRIEQGLTAYRAGGGAASLPRYLALLAEAHGSIGQTAQGLAVLTEAHTLVDKTGERAYAAEIYRLQGELLLAPDSAQHTAQQSRQNVMDAEACFYQALDMARQQEAKSLELRTAMRLSRLWQQQGKRAEAHQLLAEVYGWFTEGFDTADLQEAKALLEE